MFALCNRFPTFGEWVQQMVYSYSSAETLCKVFVHRLQSYPAHFEGLKNIGLITYLPLTYKPAMYVPSESPWNGNEDEVSVGRGDSPSHQACVPSNSCW